MAPSASDGNRIERLKRSGESVRREVGSFTSEVEGALGDLDRLVRGQLQQRPYATLAAATGFGYVLGGGMPVALTRLLLGMGGRVAFVMMAQQLRESVLASTDTAKE